MEKPRFEQHNNLIHNTFGNYDDFLRRVKEVLEKSDYKINTSGFLQNIFGSQQFDIAEARKEVSIAINKLKKIEKEKAEKTEKDKFKNKKWISESARRQEEREIQRRTGLPSNMEEVWSEDND